MQRPSAHPQTLLAYNNYSGHIQKASRCRWHYNSIGAMNRQTLPMSQQVSEDYKLLLTPPFAAMTKITDNLFLTGIGGMTRSNFAKNHIDFVVNITTDAPFWQNTESMRLALEDDVLTDMSAHFDYAVDKIHEAITQRNSHVLVHCIAGVSRSATIVIAYLMKYRRLDLRSAFNYCYNLRPVVRPNNGFMMQLMNYEQQLFGRPSQVKMVEVDVDGTLISVPNFFLEEHPKLVLLEVLRTRDLLRLQTQTSTMNQLTTNQQQQQPLQQQPNQQVQPRRVTIIHHRPAVPRAQARADAEASSRGRSTSQVLQQSSHTRPRPTTKSPTRSGKSKEQ